MPSASTAFRQDMPPSGGFPRPIGFPVEGFRKRSPPRGPASYIVVAGVLSFTIAGLARFVCACCGPLRRAQHYARTAA